MFKNRKKKINIPNQPSRVSQVSPSITSDNLVCPKVDDDDDNDLVLCVCALLLLCYCRRHCVVVCFSFVLFSILLLLYFRRYYVLLLLLLTLQHSLEFHLVIIHNDKCLYVCTYMHVHVKT